MAAVEVHPMEPAQFVKDEMDVDEAPHMASDPRKMCTYSQNDATAWILPVDMFSEIPPEVPVGARGSGWYAKRCRVLARNWKTKDYRDWLPAEVVDDTIYSLSLLSALARLSSVTKGERSNAHSVLLQARQRRLADGQQDDLYVSTVIDDLAYEPRITERTSGLMLQDVVEALDIVHKAKEDAKAQRLELRASQNAEKRMARAAERATERRKHKVRFDAQLQQSLWKEQAGGGVELVGMEYSQEPSIQAENPSAGGGHASWHDLKKQAQDSARQGREAERRRTESINQQSAQQVFRSIAARRARGGPKRRPVRARDMSQLVQDLNDDDDDNDKSWDDTDEEAAEAELDLETTIDQEPSDHNVWVNQTKKKQRPVNALVNGVQSKSKWETKDPPRAEKAKCDRETLKREHLAWKKSVEERSQRLPNEMMDFSTFGKLQSTTERAEMTDMTDALISMMEEGKKGA